MLFTITAARPVVCWNTAMHYSTTFLVAKITFNYLRPRILPDHFVYTNETHTHTHTHLCKTYTPMSISTTVSVVKLVHFHNIQPVNIFNIWLATVEFKDSSQMSLKLPLMNFASSQSHSVHTVANSQFIISSNSVRIKRSTWPSTQQYYVQQCSNLAPCNDPLLHTSYSDLSAQAVLYNFSKDINK
jgi:hypothetical protein